MFHGVVYTNSDGESVQGTYMPVMFEDLTDPILSGREELGMPKLYSAIDRLKGKSSQIVKASWRGVEWGTLEWTGLEQVEIDQGPSMRGGSDAGEGLLVQRYVPQVGRENKGLPEAEYVVVDRSAQVEPKARVQRMYKAKEANISIEPGAWDVLPTLHHITSRLAEIPIYEVVEGKIVEGTGVSDVGNAVKL
jgi:acetoacetate decarboxylase